jgi:hypothetical protein
VAFLKGLSRLNCCQKARGDGIQSKIFLLFWLRGKCTFADTEGQRKRKWCLIRVSPLRGDAEKEDQGSSASLLGPTYREVVGLGPGTLFSVNGDRCPQKDCWDQVSGKLVVTRSAVLSAPEGRVSACHRSRSFLNLRVAFPYYR